MPASSFRSTQSFAGSFSLDNGLFSVDARNNFVGINTNAPQATLDVKSSAANDANPVIRLTDSSSGFIYIDSSLGPGSYNGLTSSGDRGIIFSNGTAGTGSMVIAPWNAGFAGLKIDGATGNVVINTSSFGAGSTLTLGRVDATSEGGQIGFARATDNTQAWYIDVFGSTATPALRAINGTGTGVLIPLTLDTNGLLSGSGTSLGAWTAWTPTVTAGSGAFTTVSASGRYCQIGKTVFASANIIITTNGTAASSVIITLPVNAVAGTSFMGNGRCDAVSGKMVQIRNTSATQAAIFAYDNLYLGATGETIRISLQYEAA